MLLAAFLLFCGEASSYADSNDEPVTARLLSDRRAIAPGESFHVGLLLDLADGWHIYWRNPGDSGMPTTVKLTAPDGFEVGPTRYPLPVLFEQPGELRGIGYRKQTMLIARLKAPADLKPGQSISLKAAAEWLSCEKMCLPGGAKPKLTLPVAAKPQNATPDTQTLFARYLAQLPQTTEGLDSPVVAVITVPERLARGHRLEVNIAWRRKVTLETFLPVPTSRQIVEQTALDNQDKRSRITLKLLTAASGPQPDTLPALAIYRDAKGNRRGVNIAIKLPPSGG